nr:hypothetical protein [Tanacetum cinerariifolium]
MSSIYQNAYSFDTNYIPQSQYENYLCNLCGNNSHDVYDCQQQFLFVYEQEPSYIQNYEGNYYSHELPSFPCCDYCGGSHENFQCQPIAQNVDFSGDDQIQNPQYLDVQENSLTNDEFEVYTNANDANMNDLQFKLDNLQQDFQKMFEKKQDDFLNQMRNFMQNLHDGLPGEDKEHEATTDTELPSTEDIQPLPAREPPQNFDIRQLIREEGCVEANEEQKQKIKDTMLELVKICQEKEFLCIHDDVDDLIESALNSKLLLINSNSKCLAKKEQEVKNVLEQPAERGNRKHEHLLSMRYEHLNITPEMEVDKVTESNAENLLPIPSECEVAFEDKRECGVPISENSPVCDNHYDTFSDSKIDDDISVYDDDFEDIEYVEASLPDPDIVNIEEENGLEEENVVQQEEEEIEPDQERLINLVENNISDLSNGPLLEEVGLFLSNNSIPSGIENFADDPEGDIRFLEELLIDNSILSYESFDSNFEDNPSNPRPPPEPPDVETDAGEEIPVVIIDKDKFDDDSQFFMFDKVFSLLSAESKDTIFDPGIFD